MRIRLAILLVLLTIFFTGCGTYNTLEQALEDNVPNVQEIIQTKKVDKYTVVLFSTKPDRKEPLPVHDFTTVAVAYLKGDDHQGWEFVDYPGWTHYENKDFMMLGERFTNDDDQGNTKVEIITSFGEIRNPKVTQVQLLKRYYGEADYEDTDIIKTPSGNRYYFEIGDYYKVRVLDSKNNVIHTQGG
jgi:outer membrane lipoprotein-sorting protein